jgi:hypothetical protein
VWTEQRLFSEDRELRKLVPDELLTDIDGARRNGRRITPADVL